MPNPDQKSPRHSHGGCCLQRHYCSWDLIPRLRREGSLRYLPAPVACRMFCRCFTFTVANYHHCTPAFQRKKQGIREVKSLVPNGTASSRAGLYTAVENNIMYLTEDREILLKVFKQTLPQTGTSGCDRETSSFLLILSQESCHRTALQGIRKP